MGDVTTREGRDELRKLAIAYSKEQPKAPMLISLTGLLALLDQADAGEREWRPIDSAPKDGTHILAYRNGGVDEAWWHDDCDVIPDWFGWGGSSWRYPEWDQPTDWMPKPPPPPVRAAAEETEDVPRCQHDRANAAVEHYAGLGCAYCGRLWQAIQQADAAAATTEDRK